MIFLAAQNLAAPFERFSFFSFFSRTRSFYSLPMICLVQILSMGTSSDDVKFAWESQKTSLWNWGSCAEQKSKDKLAFANEIYDNWKYVILACDDFREAWKSFETLIDWRFDEAACNNHQEELLLQLHLWHSPKPFFRNNFLLSRSLHLFNCSFNTFLLIIWNIAWIFPFATMHKYSPVLLLHFSVLRC